MIKIIQLADNRADVRVSSTANHSRISSASLRAPGTREVNVTMQVLTLERSSHDLVTAPVTFCASFPSYTGTPADDNNGT
jgi:hypothetical protein